MEFGDLSTSILLITRPASGRGPPLVYDGEVGGCKSIKNGYLCSCYSWSLVDRRVVSSVGAGMNWSLTSWLRREDSLVAGPTP